MDFFQQQEKARRKTSLLVVYFFFAVASIIVAVYLAVAGVLFYGQSYEALHVTGQLWFPDVFAAVSLATLILITVGSLYKMVELSGGGEVVARSLGGRAVAPNTLDLRERVLLNVVTEMAIASGTPVPPVFVLDDEPAINAFAAGTTPQNAVITVTRGSIDTLNRDELQGVIAHEFSHILNGDMRLNIRLIAILNGILLIAMIGYILMRTGGGSSNISTSSGAKKGGNPLPLLGLLLYVIGYIGIFFGNLIKSAVSRQREFLADASAVQFTRLPEGIAGALKKIGGLLLGSRLQTAQAAEASHMFFGNGLTAPFLQLLATHPPLEERIRRIDPKFDGKFPPVKPIAYSLQDVVDPGTLAARRAAALGLGLAGGAARLAFAPAAAVAQVGAPRREHLDYAAALVDSLPKELASGVRDPLGAVAIIYALLLNDDHSDVRQNQLAYLATKADPNANQETLRIAPLAATIPAAAKLPLVGMTLPALKSLSPKQLAAFRDDVVFLIEADHKVSLFEFAVNRLVLKRLLPRLERKQPKGAQVSKIDPLLPACGVLLSALAYSGTRDEDQAKGAFQLGVGKLSDGSAQVKFLPHDQFGLKVVDTALDQMVGAAPMIKKQILEACAACIGADGTVTVEEGELLRVISDALACPMPPLVDARWESLSGSPRAKHDPARAERT